MIEEEGVGAGNMPLTIQFAASDQGEGPVREVDRQQIRARK